MVASVKSHTLDYVPKYDFTPVDATYDTLGRKLSETDQLNCTTDYEYDVMGQLTAVVQPAVADPENGNTLTRPRTEYTYDRYGQQLTQKDAKGRIINYTYDSFGRRTSRVLPGDTTGEAETFDSLGRQKTHKDFKGQEREKGTFQSRSARGMQ